MLGERASEAARRFGDRTAYATPDGWSVSYHRLDSLSDEVAAELARLPLTAMETVDRKALAALVQNPDEPSDSHRPALPPEGRSPSPPGG